MPSGAGIKARSGPPPNPNALNRERDAGVWIDLPAAGRAGRAPAWPLSKATARERSLWQEMWRKPQAIMWERFGQQLEVALFVRRFVEASEPGAALMLTTIVRQMHESLGISTPGLLRNRWRIVDDVVARPDGAAAPRKPRRSALDRLTVVDGGAATGA